MAKKSSWLLRVQRTERVTPNMQRIAFTISGPEAFPQDTASAYLKLAFQDRESRVVRSYTVRNFDPASSELEMDFVVHDDAGPASRWAESAGVGDTLEAGGPGPKKLLKLAGDWSLVVGDMSALPAIGANLAHLPHDANGFALIEILDIRDRQPLDAPPGVEVSWIVNPDPARSAEVMMAAVRSLDWPAGQCEAWIAGELDTVRAVRVYLKAERDITRDYMYASSYWQHGLTDEQHRIAKRTDQEAVAAD